MRFPGYCLYRYYRVGVIAMGACERIAGQAARSRGRKNGYEMGETSKESDECEGLRKHERQTKKKA